ncbi:hypothetical protein [Actinoplanes sp. CA-252034]|uniref:hypothetical protein n=1 Tax=Actinoplanes sp. CA-252034 TaxID=3239906 RepID=UPI003D975064
MPRLMAAAVAAYLGRYRGQSRLHTDSHLKVFPRWPADQVSLPRRWQRAIDRAVEERDDGPISGSSCGARMDRHAARRRLKHPAETAELRIPKMHQHMLRHILPA